MYIYILIILLFIYLKRREGFAQQIGDYQYGTPLFKYKQCIYYSDPKNRKRIEQHKWGTKLPVLVNHRYSYNDIPHRCHHTNTNKLVYLKDLPLDLKNVWHARVCGIKDDPYLIGYI